jgi:hypothetical protein
LRKIKDPFQAVPHPQCMDDLADEAKGHYVDDLIGDLRIAFDTQ